MLVDWVVNDTGVNRAHAITLRDDNMKHSNILSFVIGVLLTISVIAITFIVFNVLNPIFWIDTYPDSGVASLVLTGLDFAIPIIEGKLWKSKTNWYWAGMLCGLGVLYFIGLIEGLSAIGSNPEILLQSIW